MHTLQYLFLNKIILLTKQKFLLFFVVILLSLCSNFAKSQEILTLSQAIQNGLTNNKSIGAGKLDLSIQKLQTKAIYRKFWPQASIEYSYLYNPILQTSILPIGVFNPTYPIDATKSVQFGTKWTQSIGITATQPILDISIQQHIKEAKLQERIAFMSQEKSEVELAYTIAQTYINIYLEEAKIKTLIADTNRTFVNYTFLKNKYDVKYLLKSDLNKSIINHNNTVQLLLNEIAELIQDKVYLLFLMGMNDKENWTYEIDTNFSRRYVSENRIDSVYEDQLPNLKLLNLQSQLANLQTKSERIKHLPNINLKGYLGANHYSNLFNPVAANSWFGLSYVGLDVKLPILFGESSKNKIQQLSFQSNQFSLQREHISLKNSNDIILTNIKMGNLEIQLHNQEENIALSNESLAIFYARVQEGQETASNLNLEEANLQVLEAEYQANKKQFWNYWLDNLNASGQLSMLWK